MHSYPKAVLTKSPERFGENNFGRMKLPARMKEQKEAERLPEKWHAQEVQSIQSQNTVITRELQK